MKAYFFWLLFSIITLCFTSGCIDKEISVQESYIDTEYRTEYNVEKKLVIEQEVEPVSSEDYLEPVKSWNDATIFWEVTQKTTSVLYYKSIDNVWYYGFDIPDHKNNKIVIDIHTPANMERPSVLVLNFTNIEHIDSCQVAIPKISFNPGTTTSLDFNEDYKEWYEEFMSTVDNTEEIKEISQSTDGSAVMTQYQYDVTGISTLVVLCVNAQYTWSPVMKTTLYWEDEKITETEVMKEVEVPYQVPYEVERQRTVTKVVKVPFWELWFSK